MPDRPPPRPGCDGSTELLLRRLGQRYAGIARATVGAASALVAPFAEPAAGPWAVAAVAGLFIAWSGWYLHRMRRGAAAAWGSPTS